jgi:hypothetical protein
MGGQSPTPSADEANKSEQAGHASQQGLSKSKSAVGDVMVQPNTKEKRTEGTPPGSKAPGEPTSAGTTIQRSNKSRPTASRAELVKTAAPKGPAAGGNTASIDHWAGRINFHIGHTVRDLIELGQLFLDAKSALQHGQWEEMFDSGKIHFHLRWAQRLMRVAKNPALAKATNSSFLPPCVQTLEKMAQYDESVIQSAIDEGKIRSDMKAADVKKSLLQGYKEAVNEGSEHVDRDKARQAIWKWVLQALEKLPLELRQLVASDLTTDLQAFLSLNPPS